MKFLQWLKKVLSKSKDESTFQVTIIDDVSTTPVFDQINWAFIRELEGFFLEGYIPLDLDAVDRNPSGVTIGAGFDLGQHSTRDLHNMGLSDNLFDKLFGYCNFTGQLATSILAERPLRLTVEEGEELTLKVRAKHLKELKRLYNSNSEMSFCGLSPEQQTVIASVAFQYGNLKKACPKFFKYVIIGDWKSVIKELSDFGDSYQTRRTKEWKYLHNSLTKENKND